MSIANEGTASRSRTSPTAGATTVYSTLMIWTRIRVPIATQLISSATTTLIDMHFHSTAETAIVTSENSSMMQQVCKKRHPSATLAVDSSG